MFCIKCGKNIPDNTRFCIHCGAPQSGVPQGTAPGRAAFQPAQQPFANPQPKKGLKIGGIVLLVLGILSVFGALANGTYAYMSYRFDLSDLFMILIQAGLIIGGTLMILNSQKSGM